MATKVDPKQIRQVATDLRAIADELDGSREDMTGTSPAECKAGALLNERVTAFYSAAAAASARPGAKLRVQADQFDKYAEGVEKIQADAKKKVEDLSGSVPDTGSGSTTTPSTPSTPTTPTVPTTPAVPLLTA